MALAQLLQIIAERTAIEKKAELSVKETGGKYRPALSDIYVAEHRYPSTLR
ncbi:MAG: hypothetical protein ACYDEV_11735 [Acidiferrobacter sp.]